MIAKFYAWDIVNGQYVLVLSAIVGSAQYNNGIKNLVLKYERGYIKVKENTIFRWKWSA